MMRRGLVIVGLLAVIAGAHLQRASGADQVLDPDMDIIDVLSGVDYVPTKPVLDTLPDPEGTLNSLARDRDEDPGVRMRAIWALAQYPGDASRDTVNDTLAELVSATDGTDLLLLRAAMYALVAVDPTNSVALLGDLLEHPVRDVRADAAHALGQTGQEGAIPVLLERLRQVDGETEPHVRWALTEAVRTLSSND